MSLLTRVDAPATLRVLLAVHGRGERTTPLHLGDLPFLLERSQSRLIREIVVLVHIGPLPRHVVTICDDCAGINVSEILVVGGGYGRLDHARLSKRLDISGRAEISVDRNLVVGG